MEGEPSEAESHAFSIFELSVVQPGLYLSGIGPTRNHKRLLNLNVVAVVSVALEADPKHQAPGITYLHIPIIDEPNVPIGDHFASTTEFIHRHRETGGGVLVHCMAGMSRSVSMVAAYLVRYQQMSLYDAIKVIKIGRPIAHPNDGFMRHLLEWEYAHTKKNTVDCVFPRRTLGTHRSIFVWCFCLYRVPQMSSRSLRASKGRSVMPKRKIRRIATIVSCFRCTFI